MHQRGFTTLEVLVAAAIAVVLCAAGIGLSQASHPFAMRSAVTQFDAALDYARAIAPGSGGATILISPAGLAVFSGRPTAPDALRAAPLAPMSLPGVAVSEAAAGSEPLALFVGVEGRVTVAQYSGATPAPMASEPACPASGVWTITFADARSTARRVLACSAAESSP